AFGSGAMTNSIAEMADTDVMLVIGSNTTENHPVIGTVLRRNVLLNGGKIIVCDPRKIGLVQDAALWLRQRPGSDVALINGLLNVIFSEGLQNQAFIDERTENVAQCKDAVLSYTPEKVEQITGVPADDIRSAARLYAGAERAAIFYAMGITQHRNGTDNVKALANLAMACGHIGRPGTGVNPLRGQNNVQGACDMGGLPNVYPGYQKVDDPAINRKMTEAWGVDLLPNQPGLTLTEIIEDVHHDRIKALYVMGENPVLSDPDSNHVKTALENCHFLVVQDIFLTETAALADVVLPSACWAESDVTFTNTERRVQMVRKAVPAPGLARDDWRILADLCTRFDVPGGYNSAKQVMDEIAKVTPSYGGISYPRLERGGLQWPCPDIRHPGTPILHAQGFTRGKGLFAALEHIEPAELPDAGYPYTLTTGRILYQYHTGTMTRRSGGLNDLAPHCQVEINPADAEELGLKNGDQVRVASRRGQIEAEAWVTPRVGPKVVFIPFHYAESPVNKLTNKVLDPVAKIPEYKVCAVQVGKA
ncbi:MAG: molybdopterin-dependent oxidoreductase, partial [Pseudomonadota bacterium]